MKNQFKILISIIALLGLIWYFFLKQDDYIVTFQVKTIPSIVFNSINNWEETVNKVTKQKVVTISEIYNSSIAQKIIHQDSTYILNWTLKPINDSVTTVRVGVSERNSSLKNRVLIPFGLSPIKKYALNTVSIFAKGLQNHLENYKVEVNGKVKTLDAFCVCKAITTSQNNKASEMLSANVKIMTFLNANDLIFLGKPILQLTNWDSKTEKISFDFCFPIKKRSDMPSVDGVFYKEIKPFDAVKATYKGNYRTSDRAWYELVYYAEKNGIKHTNNMMEVFYNDPQQGGDELKWKAEIFMPVLK